MTDQTPQLSERELEILRMVATGASNKEIAHTLFISANTVKVHLRNIFAKIEVSSRTEATMWAVRSGLVHTGGEYGSDLAAALPAPLAPVPARYFPAWAWAVGLFLTIFFGIGVWAFTRPPVAAPAVTVSASPPRPTAPSNWQLRTPMPLPRAAMAIAQDGARIYLIGGRDAGQALTSVEAYLPTEDRWLTLPPKPTAASSIQAAFFGGRIYVPGGLSGDGEPLDVLEIYDPARQIWEQGAPLPVAVSGYALAAFEGRLYLFGGSDGNKALDTAWVYNPERDVWSPLLPMPLARADAGAVALGENIFLIGGRDESGLLDLVSVYSPNDEERGQPAWTEGFPLPAGRAAMHVLTVADNIYVLGGEVASSDPTLALQFVIGENRWLSFNSPFDGWSLFGAALHQSRLYGFGGYNQGGLSGRTLVYQLLYTILLPVIR